MHPARTLCHHSLTTRQLDKTGHRFGPFLFQRGGKLPPQLQFSEVNFREQDRLEAAQVASILPGPYKMRGYRCSTWLVATNKPPILPYRGVARTGVCFALEVMLDIAARELGISRRTLHRKINQFNLRDL